MHTKRMKLAVVGIVMGLVLIAGVLGRRAIYHALAERQMSKARSIVSDYLAGKSIIDSAGVALMRALERSRSYEDQAGPGLGSGAGSLSAIRLAPAGVPEDDPRISALFRRGMILTVETPEGRAHLEAGFRRLDSLEAARRGSP
jgi:hypothetical protein